MPKKENIQGMFDNIAPEYDRLNHLMSLDIDKTWRKRALTQIFKPNLTERAMTAAGDSENFAREYRLRGNKGFKARSAGKTQSDPPRKLGAGFKNFGRKPRGYSRFNGLSHQI